MTQETIFPFKLGLTKEVLTARSGLALFAEYNQGIGLRELVDKHYPNLAATEASSPRYL